MGRALKSESCVFELLLQLDRTSAHVIPPHKVSFCESADREVPEMKVSCGQMFVADRWSGQMAEGVRLFMLTDLFLTSSPTAH